MARILFTVPPLTGHLNPALAVAAVLGARGHEVAWAIHESVIGRHMPGGARIFGLDAADSMAESDPTQVPRGLESVRLFFEDYAIPMARRLCRPLEAITRDFAPDVMVVDHQMPAGALVARRLGLPWVTLVTTTASIQLMSPPLEAWVADQYAGLQADYLPREAVAARPDFSPHRVIVFSVEALIGTSRARIEAPYAFVGPVKGHVRRPVDFPWEWLRDDRRRLFVSLGTVSRDRDTRFFETIMGAVAGLDDVQAVLVAPTELAARAPANVLVRDYVPQLDLLDRVEGVICHAGHNTVCESLLRGRPLIVAPIRDDQPVIARQVIEAGAGLFMRHGKVTESTARATIRHLLDTPALTERATELGTALRAAPGEAGAATIIAGLAGN